MRFTGTTKGPWFAVQYACYWNIQIGEYYGDVNILDEEVCPAAEANARLVAASPDLLEALQELLQVKEWKDKNGKDEHYLKSQPIAWKNAESAIKKAVG